MPTRTALICRSRRRRRPRLVGIEVEARVRGCHGVFDLRSATITEIRISEVEIISMLTPAAASAVKNFALTPGCVRIPAPISDTLPIRSS
jgi:hypothetical protein